MRNQKFVQYLSILFLSLISSIAYSQKEQQPFSGGHIYGDVFLNANHNFNSSQTSFRLNRLHLGYKHQYNEHFYFNGMIESAREDYEPQGDYNGITNLFEFCLGFNYEKISGKVGLIGTELNQLQEKLWKNRYIDKVFADKYGLAPTNDFGGMVIYKPIDFLNIDLAVTNGEGHKNAQVDSAFRYALGITANIPGNFVLRLYNDIVNNSLGMQINTIAMAGYSSDKLSVGVEYNKQTNKDYIDDYSFGGFSGYCSYNFLSKLTAFGRFDYLSYKIPEGLPETKVNTDGSLIIAGIQYQIHEKIIIALDHRYWDDPGSINGKSYLFLDLAVNF